MYLLNKTNFYKIIIFVFCVGSFLHTKNPIVPLKILKTEKSDNIYFYATNEQKNNIGLYKINTNNAWEHLWEYNFDSNNYPRANNLYDSIVSLPIYPGLKDRQLDYIISNIREMYFDYSS